MTTLKTTINTYLLSWLKSLEASPDVSEAQYTKYGDEVTGFEPCGFVFMDSCIVEVKYSQEDVKEGRLVAASLNKRLSDVFGSTFGFKVISKGFRFTTPVVKVKVSAPFIDIDGGGIFDLLESLPKHGIYLVNYDITVDCKFISTRNIVREHLLKK
ncbi:hypothetical protein LPJ78_005271, partial [Coemansia sp. RSA 989]